jgi:hypothetical protein
VARIESDADYGGPGAGFTAALADGLAFNWEGTTLTSGGAARLDWVPSVGEHYDVEVVGRYDLRWTRTVDADDSAQEFSSRCQLLTLRADVVGSTDLRPFGHRLGWRAIAGYRRFLEGDLFDVRGLVQLGGALELDVGESLPACRTLSLNAGLVLGEDVTGWSLGIGASL